MAILLPVETTCALSCCMDKQLDNDVCLFVANCCCGAAVLGWLTDLNSLSVEDY
eukprot:m.13424 g.13424  ORF g.13424 m.13424 type:complete len:54 (-) comp10154_c0_seq3:34-195(-)